VGYLAFPIQMTYRYPVLARFMAGHWATEAVHFVPVFGERGALLEHRVFCLFYNWPLTIRRRMRERSRMRAAMKPRYWHIVPVAIGGSIIFGLADFIYIWKLGDLPSLKDIWWLVMIVPVLCGAGVTLGAGGALLWKRVIEGAVCGGMVGVLYTALSSILGYSGPVRPSEIVANLVWRVFVFAILSTFGVLLTEIRVSEKIKCPSERSYLG
jgi:hypothetical protein